MKQHAVLLTDDAQADLQELYDYIAVYDAPAKADAVLKEAQINSSWRAITWLGRSAALLFLQISRYLLHKAPCSPSQPKRRASTRINLRFLNRQGFPAACAIRASAAPACAWVIANPSASAASLPGRAGSLSSRITICCTSALPALP